MAQRSVHSGYEPTDYGRLLEGDLPLSRELLETHLGLYKGYVKNTNKALQIMRGDETDAYPRGEVRRRFAWEFNGMRLHELYFDALRAGGVELQADHGCREALEREFGSADAWRKRFRQVGAIRGIGWACLTYDPIADRLFNTWINEHDAGALAGTHPLLLMDVFEHAFMQDFGTDREAYMDAYFRLVDWDAVERRYQRAVADRSDRP